MKMEFLNFEEWFTKTYPIGFDSPVVKAVAHEAWIALRKQVSALAYLHEYKDNSGKGDIRFLRKIVDAL